MKRYDVAALGLYALLTLVLASSLVSNIDTVLAGRSSDVYVNLWVDWWTRKALTEGLDFYHTDYLFYPLGTSLVFHSFSHTTTFLSLLMAPLIGRFAAYNVVILLSYVLSGFSMYLLTNRLTGCRPASLVAGLVFAFYPFHIYESSHPVLVTTQWIPLFALALVRALRETGLSRIRQILLAALWFLLTALSSWHLMIMLGMWMALYLLYGLLLERSEWAPRAFRSLVLLAVVIGVTVGPFLWPIIREQLTTDTGYMVIDAQRHGFGNDLLSFVIPNRDHPLLGSISKTLAINDEYGFTRRRSAYLGYVCLGLAIGGVATARRKARFWSLAGLVFFVLSLGSQVSFNGAPLHSFVLPWSIPIIGVLRHAFRLDVLLFFSLSVLVGYGCCWLYSRIALRSRMLARIALVSVAGLILFEYLVHPFPTTKVSYSPFWYQLAQEEGDFAVADFPWDGQHGKYYMSCQTLHGKKIIGGRVSRKPRDADAFVEANPLLAPLEEGTAPDPTLDIDEEFAELAAQGIRYIVVHKHFLKSDAVENWRRWLAKSSSPYYEDERLLVYCTEPTSNSGAP